MKKAACYIRVSTDNQLENYSIEEQKVRLEAYCKARDYTIYRIYTDGGYSGGNTDRPALKLMLEDIKKFDTVIVYKLDRLSRSQKDTLTLIEDNFIANDVNFISISENFDTSTPFGKAMIGILSVFAQLEKDQITERFTMGRIGRCKAGYFHGGGNAPKGYRYIDGNLIAEPYEAEQVNDVFKLFIAGKSVNAVSKIMTDKYKNKLWDNSNKITNCIRNEIYIGIVKFGDQRCNGSHTPIVTNDIFHRANELLNSDERQNSKNTAQKTPFRAGYLLSSLVFCGKCGAKYHACHSYYKCYSRAKSNVNFIKDPNCKNINWAINDLDDAITNEIEKINLNQEYKKIFNNPIKPVDISELKNIDNQIAKLVELYQLSDIPIDTIKNKLNELQTKKEYILNLTNVPIKNNSELFEISIKKFIKIKNSDNIDEKRILISTLIGKIIINDNNIQVIWRI